MNTEQLPDVYNLQSIEQIRALADPLRVRIIGALTEEPMTAKQVAVYLDEPPQRTHYHIRELEKAGLLKLVGTREHGGILEKYYRALANGYTVPESLISSMSRDEAAAAMNRLLISSADEFLRVFGHPDKRFAQANCTVNISGAWLTEEEYREVNDRMTELLEPYQHRRRKEGVHEYSFVLLSYRAMEHEDGD